MAGLQDLPERVFKFIESGVVAEFSTVSASGLPIDTPTYYFPSDDLATLDWRRGYPIRLRRSAPGATPRSAYSSRARRTSRSWSYMRAPRCATPTFRPNCVRYIAETGFKGISHGVTWEQARQAVTYWSRIIIENKPERVYWWDNQAAMDGPPQVWSAPADTFYPASDPKPSGEMRPSAWPVRPWQEVARDAVVKRAAAHLTVVDSDGYPMPIRARAFELVAKGFRLVMPRGVPWHISGKASLTFAGFQTFIGDVVSTHDGGLFKAERALPEHPSTRDTKQVLQPSEDTLKKAWARLEYEAQRRGQPIPTPPVELPAATRLAKLRQARVASDKPITGLTAEHGNRTT